MTVTQGFLDHKIFQIISDTASSLGVRAFVIGGYVRDCFLGRPSKDIDVVVEGSGIELAEAVGAAVHSHVSVFRNFGTAMLKYRGIEVEFVGARKESYRRDSRKPIHSWILSEVFGISRPALSGLLSIRIPLTAMIRSG